MTPEPMLRVSGLVKRFPVRSGFLQREENHVLAVDGVDLSLERGQTLGVVGESGSGKSTLARCILRLAEPSAGDIRFHGADVNALRGAELSAFRRSAGMVFQDPLASLNRRQTVGQAIAEPLRVHRLTVGSRATRRRVEDLLAMVHLDVSHASRYPKELSGGQRQRVAIARAMATEPELLVLDEPVSSLDVSIGAQVLNLLMDLQAQTGVAYIFISHDLSVVHHVADEVAVMYLGAFVETGSCDAVFTRPRHPYTQALLSAIPVADPMLERQRTRIRLRGEPPSPLVKPSGCRFHTRCRMVVEDCRRVVPLLEGDAGHAVACILADTSPDG